MEIHLFSRDLNRGCLVYMFPLRFSESKCLINLRRQYRVRKIFSRRQLRTQVYAGLQSFHLRLKLLFRKCVTYVVGCFFKAH